MKIWAVIKLISFTGWGLGWVTRPAEFALDCYINSTKPLPLAAPLPSQTKVVGRQPWSGGQPGQQSWLKLTKAIKLLLWLFILDFIRGHHFLIILFVSVTVGLYCVNKVDQGFCLWSKILLIITFACLLVLCVLCCPHVWVGTSLATCLGRYKPVDMYVSAMSDITIQGSTSPHQTRLWGSPRSGSQPLPAVLKKV